MRRLLGALESRDKLVQLQMDRQRVLVLRTLDEKHHQERDNGCTGIDHELPRVRVTKAGPNAAHTTMIPTAQANALVLPAQLVTAPEARSRYPFRQIVFASHLLIITVNLIAHTSQRHPVSVTRRLVRLSLATVPSPSLMENSPRSA
jgi:hypothetical protein